MTLVEQLKTIDPESYKAAVQDLMHELNSNFDKAWEQTIARAHEVPILAAIVQTQIDLTKNPDTNPDSLNRIGGMRFSIEALIAYAESQADSEFEVGG